MVEYFKNLIQNYKRMRYIKTEIHIFEIVLLIIVVLNFSIYQFFQFQDVAGRLQSIKQQIISTDKMSLANQEVLQGLLSDSFTVYTQLKPLLPSSLEFQRLKNNLELSHQSLQNLLPKLTSLKASDFVDMVAFKDLHLTLSAVNELDFQLKNLNQSFQDIPKSQVPGLARDQFLDLQTQFAQLTTKVNFMIANLNMLADFSGLKSTHRYLIAIQNNAEIRPLGGFSGLFALVNVSAGRIQDIDVIDVYQLDGQYLPHISPPPNLAGLNSKVFIRDLNYTSDPKVYLQLLKKELETLKFPSFDTAIIVNQSVFQDILEILGDQKIPGRNFTLTPQNYFYALTLMIESEKAYMSDDKIVIKKTLANIVPALQNVDNLNRFIKLGLREIQSSDLHIITSNSDHQSILQEINVASDFNFYSKKNQESFLVSLTSVGGNKTDLDMQTDISHSTTLAKNQTPAHHLKLTRTHGYSLNQEVIIDSIARRVGLYPVSNSVKHILIKGDNKVVAKVHLPLGSSIEKVLVDSSPVKFEAEIEAETKSKVIYVPMTTKPYQTNTLEIKYKSGYKLKGSKVFDYKFQHIKTPGLLNANYQKSFQFDGLSKERLFVDDQSYFQNIENISHDGNTEFNLILSH